MIDGNLDQLHLGDLLQWLQMGSISGRLTLVEEGRERKLDLLDGKVVFASSAVPEERLANTLAHRSDIPIDQLRHLLGLSLFRRTIFTELLLQNGLVSADDLRVHMAYQAEVVMQRVLHAERVSFQLDTSFPVHHPVGLRLDLEPQQMLLEAARCSDEAWWDSWGDDFDQSCSNQDVDELFWHMIREAVTADDGLDGNRLAELHHLVGDILGTLAQWMSSSPGLVPLPSSHVTQIADRMAESDSVPLTGLPQATWNQMVLACSVRAPNQKLLLRLSELEQHATELDLWFEITSSETWHRPHASRLDELTRSVAVLWSRAAASAAPELGVDPDIAALAAHLAVVPTDLVLWVLTTLPVPHQGLRQTLLRHLPRKLGVCLSQVADFPAQFRRLFDPREPSALGACLFASRSVLQSADVWPATVPEDESLLLEAAPPTRLAAASAAAREVLEGAAVEQVAVG